MRNFKTAIIGFGTVGQGLAEILVNDPELSAAFPVVAIADFQKGSVASDRPLDLVRALELVKSGESLEQLDATNKGWDALKTIESSGAEVVAEATYTDIKTGEPAVAHVRTALSRGIHVTTTNKGPVALFGSELVQLAESNKASFLFEGTVMSGTPVLSVVRNNLKGCKINSVQGILNGTTNYILGAMESGVSYEAALSKAQELGYAEADPTADVEGYDALAKVVILANQVLGAQLKTVDVGREGITNINSEAAAEARRNGRCFKLVGRVTRVEGGVEASVAPVELPLDDPLAGVGGVANAISFETDLAGTVTIVGPGAGRTETGFALLSDMIEIRRRHG